MPSPRFPPESSSAALAAETGTLYTGLMIALGVAAIGLLATAFFIWRRRRKLLTEKGSRTLAARSAPYVIDAVPVNAVDCSPDVQPHASEEMPGVGGTNDPVHALGPLDPITQSLHKALLTRTALERPPRLSSAFSRTSSRTIEEEEPSEVVPATASTVEDDWENASQTQAMDRVRSRVLRIREEQRLRHEAMKHYKQAFAFAPTACTQQVAPHDPVGLQNDDAQRHFLMAARDATDARASADAARAWLGRELDKIIDEDEAVSPKSLDKMPGATDTHTRSIKRRPNQARVSKALARARAARI